MRKYRRIFTYAVRNAFAYMRSFMFRNIFLVIVLFVGPLLGLFRSLPFGLVLMLGGIVLTSLWHLSIGLLAFWTEKVLPFYLIFQKLVFIIGGMFFPIDLFPEWLQSVARVLPFAYSAYWPGRTMVQFTYQSFLTGLAGQAVYIAVLGSVVAGLYRLGARRVAVQGG